MQRAFPDCSVLFVVILSEVKNLLRSFALLRMTSLQRSNPEMSPSSWLPLPLVERVGKGDGGLGVLIPRVGMR
jgi:hypothetical protein